MKWIRWLWEVPIAILCIVGPFLSLRAVLYGLLIASAIIVFMLVSGQPKDMDDPELVQLAGSNGHVDEVDVYVLQLDRSWKSIRFYVQRWAMAFLVVIVTLGVLFVVALLLPTEASTRVSRKGEASLKMVAAVTLRQMEKDGIGRGFGSRRDGGL